MDEPLRLSKKAIARQERLAEKTRKHEGNKARLIAEPFSKQVPRLGSAEPFESRVPRVSANPDAYLDQVMVYVRDTADREGAWSWGQARVLVDEEWAGHIEPQLVQHARETWRHICALTARSKRRLLRYHHHQDVAEILKEAQDRWLDLDLKQHHTAFRFRMGSRRRLWGYRVGHVFHVVWWDTEHRISPTSPSS